MINYKLHYITLIEVLIALVLTMGILITLAFFYRQVTEIGIEADKMEEKNFKMRYIETRLGAVLPKAVRDKESDFVFFSIGDEGIGKSGSQGLIFTYNNDISLDKPFSGNVLGRLFLDPKGNLILAYWPSPKRWESGQQPPIKKEILFQGADNLAFEFYIAPARKVRAAETPSQEDKKQETAKESGKPEQNTPKPDKNPVEQRNAAEPEPKGGWRQQPWLQEYQQLPVMVKIIVSMPQKQEPYVFIYPLTHTKYPIVYE